MMNFCQITDGMPDALLFNAAAFHHDFLITSFKVAVKVEENGQLQPGQDGVRPMRFTLG